MGVRSLAGVLVATILLAVVPGASADEFLNLDGALTYSWHGDPARGCAKLGVCELGGTATLRMTGAGSDLTTSGRAGALDLSEAALIVRTLRSAPEASHTCVDAVSSRRLQLVVNLGRQKGVTTFAGSGGDSPSSGRCAGPLPSMLGAVPIAYTSTGGRSPAFSFVETRAFVAGPFSGELRSTLRASPDNSGSGVSLGGSGGSETIVSSGTPPKGRRVLDEQVDARYAVTLSGALTERFAGLAEPTCEPFDACGATGVETITLGGPRTTIELFADRIVRRRRHRSEILADLRAGRLDAYFAPTAALSATDTETVSWPDGARCSDSETTPRLFVLSGIPSFRPGRHPPSLELGIDGSASSALRTVCPGPDAVDVFGEFVEFGALSSPPIALAGPRGRGLATTIGEPGTFTSPGFSGMRLGGIRVRLRLLQMTVKTVEETAP